jgi:hypothetical protein
MADRTTGYGDRGGADAGGSDGPVDRARELKDEAQERVAHAAGEARERGEHLVEEGKEKVRELGDRAGEVARNQGDEQRQRLAKGVRTFADALRRGADDLPADRREYEGMIDGVADRVEGVSRYIEEHDVDSLTRDARRFARDHTPVFLAGAFTLGMLGARFLKRSSDEARPAGHTDRGAGRERWTSPTQETQTYGRAPTGHIRGEADHV